MVHVFFGDGTFAELVATFETEELYMLCLPTLQKEAKRQGVKVFESIKTEEEWEAEQEHQQNVDLGIHDDYLDRIGN